MTRLHQDVCCLLAVGMMSCLVPFKPFYSTRQHWTNGLARLSQLALSFRPFGSFLSFGCSDCLQSSNLLDASLDPFWLSAGFNTVVCLKWRHQQSRFEQVECRNGFMSLVKHSLLSIASTPSEVVKQVLASIESQEVFNSKESLGTLGICRVCIIITNAFGSVALEGFSHFQVVPSIQPRALSITMDRATGIIHFSKHSPGIQLKGFSHFQKIES